jgi:hypothetical protein
MIFEIAEVCIAALLGALTVVGLMIVFLALCAVMRGIALVLSYDFYKIFTREE